MHVHIQLDAYICCTEYSATSIIRTPLATALMLAIRIVRITKVLSFLTGYMVPSL